MADNKQVIVNSEEQILMLNIDNPYMPEGITVLEAPLLSAHAQVYMPRDIINKAIKIEQYKCPIRLICSVDLLMSFYYYYISFILGGVLSAISFNGILATVYYKKSLMTCYVAYQYVQVAARISNTCYFIYLVTTNDHDGSSSIVPINRTVVIGGPYTQIAILTLLSFMQGYIAYFVTKYYSYLPSKDEHARVEITSIV